MSVIDRQALIERFLSYVQIDSEAGSEKTMGERLVADLTQLGFTVTTHDLSKTAATNGFNVHATLPGDESLEPILFCCHMDTVAPGKGIRPRVCEDDYIRSDGTTILGADDKAGLCAIIEAMKVAKGGPHRTVEAAFTVCEESTFDGSKQFDYSQVASKRCIIFDADGGPDHIIINAAGINEVHAVITGKAAHAGIAPQDGVSAIQAGAYAVSNMKLMSVDKETTANICKFGAESPLNIVTDRAELSFEVRSLIQEKLDAQTSHIIACLEDACSTFGAKLTYEVIHLISPFRLSDDHPFIQVVSDALRDIGLEPKLVTCRGGSDANIFNSNGIETINLGSGMDKVHSTEEQQYIPHMVDCARLSLRLMQP